MLSALVAALHYLTLALGLGSVFFRGRAFRAVAAEGTSPQPKTLQGLLAADTAWGIAAGLWIATGFARAFSGLEKGTEFYLANHLFHLKLGLFLAVFLLELWPMITLIRWRIALKRRLPLPLVDRVATFARINDAELLGVVTIVFVASAMARGLAF